MSAGTARVVARTCGAACLALVIVAVVTAGRGRWGPAAMGWLAGAVGSGAVAGTALLCLRGRPS